MLTKATNDPDNMYRSKVITSLTFTYQKFKGQPQYFMQSFKPNKVTQDSHIHNIVKHWKRQQTIVQDTYKHLKVNNITLEVTYQVNTIFNKKIDNKSQLSDYLTKQ